MERKSRRQNVLDLWYQGKTVEEIVNTLRETDASIGPSYVNDVLKKHYGAEEAGTLRRKILAHAILFLANKRGATLEELNTIRDLIRKYILF